MRSVLILLCFFLLVPHADGMATDELPIVPEGFIVEIVAREPLVSNPCVMAFDRRGRLYVGQGPQWRAPTPETPGDRVDILIDDDGDGTADRRKTFAEGLNSIQSLAWKGSDLWIANAPDLTVVRDLDGDDEADEYIRVYTGLGNLEHSLHGLNFAPDGKLYMSKGNSRGYNRLDQLAPVAFRELWGLPSPEGAPDYTPIEIVDKASYQRNYHTPSDDWGQSGGILRCDPVDGEGNFGRNLEIVARGFRNPWDIAFDDRFHWLGTDNDQTQGDKIFAPFLGAHFGWGHAWSYHWTGEGHLPTVPASAPLFEGSGAGVIHYHASQFPPEYRNVFYVNDWMRREVYAFRPQWNGAWMQCEGGFPDVFAHADGGRTLPGSSGRVFEPTDIEVGPDGALYILSWGHGYGATLKDGKQVDAGRVYRIRYLGNPLQEWRSEHRVKSLDSWSLDNLFADLGSSIPAWRTDAQDEFLRRAKGELIEARKRNALGRADAVLDCPSAAYLLNKLSNAETTNAEETWSLWTLGRLDLGSDSIDERFFLLAMDEENEANLRLQALRILAIRSQARRDLETAEDESLSTVPIDSVAELLHSADARLRHEAVQLIRQTNDIRCIDLLLELASRETDRIVFYSTWNALRHLATIEQRMSWCSDQRSGIRLAALLGLLEDDAVDVQTVLELRADRDERVAGLVELWLEKTGGAEPLVKLNPPPGEYSEPVMVRLTTSTPNAILNYTTDGSTPVNTSNRYGGAIRIDRDATLKVIIAQDNTQAGSVITGEYRIRRVEPYRHRAFISDIQPMAPGEYRLDWTGLSVGKRHYTDRDYFVTEVPPEIQGLPFLQTCNGHDRSSGEEWLRMISDSNVTVWLGVDVRVNAPLSWMKIGEPDGFVDSGIELVTTDPTFRLYKKEFPAGPIVLGGSTNHPRQDSGRGMYVAIFDRPLLDTPANEQPVSAAEVLASMATADVERGRELFLHPQGAGCIKCHQMEGLGRNSAPDLSDIGARAREAEILIQSILEPSAVITEGFAQQQIVTIDGRVFRGAVLEETGRSLVLVDSEGERRSIAKVDIEERIGTKLSPMPDGFDKLMSAQQMADVVAWLLTQKSIGDRSGFSFRDRTDRIEIQLGEQRVATYLKQHDQLSRRALVNVMTPSGVQVTRNFPPQRPEDIDPGYGAEAGIIHPVMHPGIWLSYGDINGNDYWRLQARVLFNGFVEPLWGDQNSGGFAVSNLLLSEEGESVVCEEITRYEFRRAPDGWLLRIDAEYKSEQADFYFGDQEESGLAVRVASPLRVQGGSGTILNDRGERNGAEVWGKEANWFDYFATIEGRQVGLMIVPSPNNPRPSWLHARDYGVVVTNPFPKQPQERREPYVKTWVTRGTSFQLSYAILIHDRPASTPLNHKEAAESILRVLD